jgi:hypothetical protein
MPSITFRTKDHPLLDYLTQRHSWCRATCRISSSADVMPAQLDARDPILLLSSTPHSVSFPITYIRPYDVTLDHLREQNKTM